MTKNEQVFSMIRYANVWEDTDIALDGLGVKAGQTGAVICSGGDNVLAMLIRSPKKIYAFDVNKTQLYCTELKIAAIAKLTLEQTKCLLGVTDGDRMGLYNLIRADMSKAAQKYFDEHLNIIQNGIIHAGKFERYFQLFRKYVVTATSSKKNYREFAKKDNLEKQKEFYARKINTRRFKMLFEIFFGYRTMAKHGRDKSFFEHVDEEDVKNNGADLKKRAEFGLFHVENATNPYFDYIANNNFTHAFPQYLRPEYYEKIRANLDKVELIHGEIKDLPEQHFDFFYLSDIFEYMSEEEFQQNIEQIKQRAKKGSNILYWNMQNRRYIKDGDFRLKEKVSSELFKKNKSWFYRDLLIYEVLK